MISTTKTKITPTLIMALFYCTTLFLVHGENRFLNGQLTKEEECHIGFCEHVHGRHLRGLSDVFSALDGDGDGDGVGQYHPKEKTVYVIRHGNKEGEHGGLCDAGTYRAKEIATVFDGHHYHGQSHVFGEPDSLFYHQYQKNAEDVKNQRCEKTLGPISIKLKDSRNKNLYEHALDADKGNEYAANQIRTDSEWGLKNRAVVLVAWEHVNIPELANYLGYTDQNPKFKEKLQECQSKDGWPGDFDFDFVYTFRYANGGGSPPTEFSCSNEGITQFIPESEYGNCNGGVPK